MDIHKVYWIFQKFFRSNRMRNFEKTFNVSNLTTILDVGGHPLIWQFIACKPKVTIININPVRDWEENQEQFSFEIGNATALRFSDGSFDISFSNSVIEHLGNWDNQRLFAKEISRVGRSTYVQTPAKGFFMEPHLITPFIHWLPLKWQSKLIRNFTVWGLITRPSQEHIDNFLAERRLLSFKEFKQLFHDCKIIRERFLFFTKSYIAARAG
jgi:ubiquinone/menaquinone biosynthesis C-methylase UbiE